MQTRAASDLPWEHPCGHRLYTVAHAAPYLRDSLAALACEALFGVSRRIESTSVPKPTRSRTAEAAWPSSHRLRTSVQLVGKGTLLHCAICEFEGKTKATQTARPAAMQSVAATVR